MFVSGTTLDRKLLCIGQQPISRDRQLHFPFREMPCGYWTHWEGTYDERKDACPDSKVFAGMKPVRT